MSAHSKRKKAQHPNTKIPITYHLYIEDIGDIQFRIDINSNNTFSTILKNILHQILSLSPERNGIEKAAADQYHLIANSFPKLNKSQSHHPLLHLTIAPKMIEANNTFIEQYAQQLWSANTPSIALNGRYYRQCIKSINKSINKSSSSTVKALYILVSKPSSSNTTNSMNTNTSDIEIDDDDESLSQENINSNNNRNLNRNHNRKRKPSKPKPKKTRKKKKRKQRRYESDSDYEYSSTDGMSQDEDDDFKCNIYNELRSRHDDSDDFIPPVPKKRKLNINNMKKKLVKRNPSASRRHNLPPIYNNNNTRRTISRHNQFKPRPRPRPRIPLRRNKNKVNRQGSRPNHLIILLDASRSMTSPLHYALDGEVAVSRLSMAVKYIKKYIQIKWNTEFQKETLISFATFGEDLSVKANTRNCSPQNIKLLMGYLVDLRKEDELYDGLETETAVYQLLDKLMDMIRLGRMSRYKNTRILMFTDGENVSYAPLYGPIKNALKYKEITIDCIQTSRGERDNVALKRICTQYSHQGRFWNPLTIADWNRIFDSVDFLFPYRRDFVYDLTRDDSEEDADD